MAKQRADRLHVDTYLSMEDIINKAKTRNKITVPMFHNHQNGYIEPSKDDIKLAKEYAKVFNRDSINFLEFICGRGKYKEYFFLPSDTFLPLKGFIKAVENTLSFLPQKSISQLSKLELAGLVKIAKNY